MEKTASSVTANPANQITGGAGQLLPLLKWVAIVTSTYRLLISDLNQRDCNGNRHQRHRAPPVENRVEELRPDYSAGTLYQANHQPDRNTSGGEHYKYVGKFFHLAFRFVTTVGHDFGVRSISRFLGCARHYIAAGI